MSMDMAKAREVAARGAKLMSRLDMEWYECIDISRLRISSNERCVLGQWAEANMEPRFPKFNDCADYGDGKRALDNVVCNGSDEWGGVDSIFNGFDGCCHDIPKLNAAWKEIILFLQEVEES